jgi:hypothetical protein
MMKRIRALFKQEPLDKKEASVSDMMSKAVRLVQEDPRKREIPIAWHFDDNLPKVSVDPIPIQEVFINLISNAIEATESNRLPPLVYFQRRKCFPFSPNAGRYSNFAFSTPSYEVRCGLLVRSQLSEHAARNVRSATLAVLVPSTSISAARETTTPMSHGLICGAPLAVSAEITVVLFTGISFLAFLDD